MLPYLLQLSFVLPPSFPLLIGPLTAPGINVDIIKTYMAQGKCIDTAAVMGVHIEPSALPAQRYATAGAIDNGGTGSAHFTEPEISHDRNHQLPPYMLDIAVTTVVSPCVPTVYLYHGGEKGKQLEAIELTGS